MTYTWFRLSTEVPKNCAPISATIAAVKNTFSTVVSYLKHPCQLAARGESACSRANPKPVPMIKAVRRFSHSGN
jgi:hypothetical protein